MAENMKQVSVPVNEVKGLVNQTFADMGAQATGMTVSGVTISFFGKVRTGATMPALVSASNVAARAAEAALAIATARGNRRKARGYTAAPVQHTAEERNSKPVSGRSVAGRLASSHSEKVNSH